MARSTRAIRMVALAACTLLATPAFGQWPPPGGPKAEEPEEKEPEEKEPEEKEPEEKEPEEKEPETEEPPSGEPTAKQLFDQGLDDMLNERYDRGCPALEKSHEMEPLPGVVFTAAECNYRWGKLAAAQRLFEEFKERFDAMPKEDQEQQQHRMDVAAKRLPDLAQRVPVVTLRLPAGAPEGTVVIHEGQELPAKSLGTPKAFEPGSHTFVVRTPAGDEIERGALLQEGDRRTITLDLPVPGSGSGPAPEPTPEPDGDEDADDSGFWLFGMTGDQMRLAAYITGGWGAANLIVGIVTGAVVFAEKGRIEDNCDGLRCNDEGLDAADKAQTLALVSTISFVMAGVGLGAGTALWLLAPDDEEPAVEVDAAIGPGGGGFTFRAQF